MTEEMVDLIPAAHIEFVSKDSVLNDPVFGTRAIVGKYMSVILSMSDEEVGIIECPTMKDYGRECDRLKSAFGFLKVPFLMQYVNGKLYFWKVSG